MKPNRNYDSTLTDQEMNAMIEETRKARSGGKAQTVLGGLIISIAYIMFSGGGAAAAGGVILLLGGAILLAAGTNRRRLAERSIKERLSDEVVPQILSQVFDQVEYNEKGHIPADTIFSSGACPLSFNQVGGSDYIKGKYRGVNIEMSDITLEEKTEYTETDKHGNTRTRTEIITVLRGQWLVLDFHKELSADLGVFQGMRKRFNEVETENSAFNKMFGISCKNAHDAFYILTPHMMEHIMAMSQRSGGLVYLRFIQEGKLHVAVSSGRDHFEVGDLKKGVTLKTLQQKYRDEVQYVVDLIDELLMVDTLYKK